MIKFFRKIRQRLLTENKFSKYLIYAIGEILLVVIGILIALQINNNNEANKNRAFEVKMLHEIRNELIQDTIYFNMISERAKSGMTGAQGMLQLYTETQPNPDSLMKYGPMMSTSFQFIYHKGSYEALKSTGIDRISNDSIRFLLTDMYDFKMPRAQNFIEADESENFSSRDILRLMTNMEIIKLPNGQARPIFKPKKSFGGNKEVAELIVMTHNLNAGAVRRLDNLLSSCEDLLQLLDHELEIKNPLENMPENTWAKEK